MVASILANQCHPYNENKIGIIFVDNNKKHYLQEVCQSGMVAEIFSLVFLYLYIYR